MAGIQVIERAASILRTLERNRGGVSLGEIAKEVDLPRSTVQRIVDALDVEGLVIASTAKTGVRLGPAILRLASATRFEIAELARNTLEKLSKDTGETVDLAVFDQDKVVFVDQIPGSHRLTALSGVGLSFPLHSSANGKAILAALEASELAKMKKRIKLTRLTQNTMTSWDAIERDLAEIREKHVAFDREENSLGICAVAMAITSPTGEMAAISLPVPTHRFLESEATLVRKLKSSCAQLQQKLVSGYAAESS